MSGLLQCLTLERCICGCYAETVVKLLAISLLFSGLVTFVSGFVSNYIALQCAFHACHPNNTKNGEESDCYMSVYTSYFYVITGLFLIWANWHLLKGIRKRKEKHVMKWIVAKGILIFFAIIFAIFITRDSETYIKTLLGLMFCIIIYIFGLVTNYWRQLPSENHGVVRNTVIQTETQYAVVATR